MESTQWYKDAVFYQIWPRSFCDGNGDGIGDLWGVLSKLDYIASFGVTGIWFSPLYPSPQADFGYDIADYYDINPEYGDLDLFKRVLDEAHERGLRVEIRARARPCPHADAVERCDWRWIRGRRRSG